MRVADGTLAWLLVIGLGVPLLTLWIVAYVDVARRRDLRFTRKLLWAAAIFFTAYIGIAAYFMMRPVAPWWAGTERRQPRDRPDLLPISSPSRSRVPQTESHRGHGHDRGLSGEKTGSAWSDLIVLSNTFGARVTGNVLRSVRRHGGLLTDQSAAGMSTSLSMRTPLMTPMRDCNRPAPDASMILAFNKTPPRLVIFEAPGAPPPA